MWAILLIVMALLNAPLMLMWYWFVFGLWPVSWMWFFIFAFVSYGQQELAKYALKKFATSAKESL